MRGLMGETISILRKRAEFLAANKGLRNARPGFVLLTLANDNLGKRFGVTVTRKIGNAVVRNRMKRRFRALARDILPESGTVGADHVLIGRAGGIERDYAALESELRKALNKLAKSCPGEGLDSAAPRGETGPRPSPGHNAVEKKG